MAIRYWLGVVHRGDVLRGVELGIAQINHGQRAAVERMNESDGLVYYSPRVSYPDGEPLREFTAIGRISPGDVFQADVLTPAGEKKLWRRRVDYLHDAEPAPIRPLIPVLEFTRDSPNWGYQLRRGLIELSKHDFEIIRHAMQPPLAEDRLRQRGVN